MAMRQRKLVPPPTGAIPVRRTWNYTREDSKRLLHFSVPLQSLGAKKMLGEALGVRGGVAPEQSHGRPCELRPGGCNDYELTLESPRCIETIGCSLHGADHSH